MAEVHLAGAGGPIASLELNARPRRRLTLSIRFKRLREKPPRIVYFIHKPTANSIANLRPA